MAEQNKQMGHKLNIHLPEEVADGIYANMVIIAHSQSEFVFDFARITPGAQKTKVQTRVIMTPANAIKFMKTMEDNIKKFQEKYGEIDIQGVEKNKGIGFSME